MLAALGRGEGDHHAGMIQDGLRGAKQWHQDVTSIHYSATEIHVIHQQDESFVVLSCVSLVKDLEHKQVHDL